MNRVLDVNFADRTATVEAGITNLGISNMVAQARFFYAPDPSSQLACTIGGNIAMNSGGAHCLKYGVTANNVLKLKMVLMDGEIVELGGDYLDAEGYDLLGFAIGSEGQFGIVTEATVRILKQAEGARPMLIGFPSAEAAGACVAAIIADGLIPRGGRQVARRQAHLREHQQRGVDDGLLGCGRVPGQVRGCHGCPPGACRNVPWVRRAWSTTANE